MGHKEIIKSNRNLPPNKSKGGISPEVAEIIRRIAEEDKANADQRRKAPIHRRHPPQSPTSSS
jgi:hypothetical protein